MAGKRCFVDLTADDDPAPVPPRKHHCTFCGADAFSALAVVAKGGYLELPSDVYGLCVSCKAMKTPLYDDRFSLMAKILSEYNDSMCYATNEELVCRGAIPCANRACASIGFYGCLANRWFCSQCFGTPQFDFGWPEAVARRFYNRFWDGEQQRFRSVVQGRAMFLRSICSVTHCKPIPKVFQRRLLNALCCDKRIEYAPNKSYAAQAIFNIVVVVGLLSEAQTTGTEYDADHCDGCLSFLVWHAFVDPESRARVLQKILPTLTVINEDSWEASDAWRRLLKEVRAPNLYDGSHMQAIETRLGVVHVV